MVRVQLVSIWHVQNNWKVILHAPSEQIEWISAQNIEISVEWLFKLKPCMKGGFMNWETHIGLLI